MMEPVALRLLGEPLEKHHGGNEWRYRNRGSLKIDIAKGTWHDFEANLGGGVVELIAKENNCDRGGAIAWLQREGLLAERPTSSSLPKAAEPKRPNFVCAYDYVAEDGAFLFQSVRYADPKTFRYRRPGAKHGDWIWNLEGVRNVPYRLPDLIKAVTAGRHIFIAEGEKDADNLRSHGFAATTNPGGAGKWRQDFSEFLKGANVVILADNDHPGRTHSEQVAASLSGIAKRIRILDIGAEWPECPPKGDISDWIAVVSTASKPKEIGDKLKELVGKLTDWKPTSAASDSEAWKTEPAWPVLDQAAYHGLAGDVVKTLNPHTEADPVGILIQFLTTFGNIIGNSPYYQVESNRHHANLFSVHVGASAKGRKGTAGGRVKAVTKLADEIWSNERIASGLSSGEGLIYAVRDEVHKWDANAKEYAIVDPGVADKRLLVTEPEFAGALSAMERHGNTLSPVIRNAWDGETLQTMTRASPLKATGAHISIIAHITEAEARARLTRTEMANGFANRFLFCCVKRSKLLPHGGDLTEAELSNLCQRVKGAVEFARQVGRVKMTKKAAEAWTAAYPELSAERQGLLGAVIARSEAQVIRLSLIFALLDSHDAVSPKHLEAAMAVWAYCEELALRIFGASLGDPVADDILRALRRSGTDGMTRTAISDLFARNRSSDQIGAALALLMTKGCARMEAKTTGGRPIEVWFAVGGTR